MADDQLFRFAGVDSNGNEKTGTFEAESEPAALEFLRDSGISVTSLKRVRHPKTQPRKPAASRGESTVDNYKPRGKTAASMLGALGFLLIVGALPMGGLMMGEAGGVGILVIVYGVTSGLFLIVVDAVVHLLNDIVFELRQQRNE